MLKNSKLFSLSCAAIGCVLSCENVKAQEGQNIKTMPVFEQFEDMEQIARMPLNNTVFVMRNLQVIYNYLGTPVQRRFSIQQVERCFFDVVYQLNYHLNTVKLDLPCLQAANEINTIFLDNLEDNDIEQLPIELKDRMILIYHREQALANLQIISTPQTEPNVYQAALRQFLRSINIVFPLNDIEIPHLEKQQIPYAINALIEFLQNDVSEEDVKK